MPGPSVEDFSVDVLIASCGFESRSIHATKELQGRFDQLLVYGYLDNQVLSFEQNRQYFEALTTVPFLADADAFASRLTADLEELLTLDGRLRIAVDISSMDRSRLGATVRTLTNISATRRVDVTFIYSVGTFDSLFESPDAVVLVNRPLLGFEAWARDPALPVACVIGLGFENILALAALEMLEPTRTIAMIAESADSRFQARVRIDNAALMKSPDIAEVGYSVDFPFRSLHVLEDIVHALRAHFRVVIVPLGPKVFALLAMLVALEYDNEVAVWRVSADLGRTPRDRPALGPISTIQVIMGAEPVK